MLDQQLTSFPLAPPPAPKGSKTFLRSPEFNAHESEQLSSRDSSPLVDNRSIVLVEDYIKSKRLGRKKLSVLELKSTLKNFDTHNPIHEHEDAEQVNYITRARSILTMNASSTQSNSIDTKSSSLLLTMSHLNNDYSNDCFTACSSHTTDFTSITGSLYSLAGSMATLKLTDSSEFPMAEFSISEEASLKYCVICEAPLYDISSDLVGSDASFEEFVCCNCTERYEVLSRLLDEFDESLGGMMTIPEDIEDIEEALGQPAFKRRKNSEFSKTLVDRLKGHLTDKSRTAQSLSFEAMMDRKSAMWLLDAKKKLRWRWRISGLVPRFLHNDKI